MRVSCEWLKEYIKLDLSPAELADKMTMAGIAVEAVEDQAAQYQGMVVAKVLKLEKHTQANNLWISQLDCGAQGTRQVVTAAQNVREGQLIPVALPGTVLANGQTIRDAELKGVLSQGMMCSGEELGLEKESTGIWIFTEDLKPGTPVAEALQATDHILVLELTANRPDCYGMINVAREVAAILGTSCYIPTPEPKEAGPDVASQINIAIADPDLCPRYSGRVVLDVKIGPSPKWMQRRLIAAGIRPISNIVDITNYVMLEYNQPMHAFDLDHIADRKIIVRRARSGEKLMTLDDQQREFKAEELLIADPNGGLCVAGVMGGATSEVTDQTQNILFESAYFAPASIRATAKLLEMRTESSHRFERGIDPNGTVGAINRAVELIEQLGIGTVTKGVVDVYPKPVTPRTITTGAGRINGWLGTDLTAQEIQKYLERVHFNVALTSDGGIKVEVPTYRQDVTHMADLAEEVARLYGYDRIPATLPVNREIGERTSFQAFQADCRSCLQGMGLSEVMAYTLYSKDIPAKLGLPAGDPWSRTVELMVPLSEEQAVMRTNMVHGLLATLGYNAKRRQNDLAVYEIGRVYWPQEEKLLPDEPVHLAVGLMGRMRDMGWNQSKDEFGFYDIKGILESLAEKMHLPAFSLQRSTRPFLHPGRSAEIGMAGRNIGFFGEVHPDILQEYELNKTACILEIDLAAIEESRTTSITYEALPKFPAIERDLAIVVAKNIPAAEIVIRIREIGGQLIERVELFDVYQGDQVPNGARSLAFSISYRSKDRTLSDNEITPIQEELLRKLNETYGAAIRS